MDEAIGQVGHGVCLSVRQVGISTLFIGLILGQDPQQRQRQKQLIMGQLN